uniref:DUF6314 domain-containing protein n=1 Tax=Alexandrium monilatum TaxID=311494 RepID=A0A7S4Q472_9DINO|mmetsp:Transcript_100184/g.299036  ORF Transcript_100184/g.299036 Transcript_100184/m.299036 type:complete len:192 (+) Transcript_100184:58-633(+)
MALPRLTSGEAVKAFLAGRWILSKTFDYRIGGGRGKMEGFATFAEAPQLRTALMYEERGTVQLEGLSNTFEAYRRYCFNTAKWPVEVYFVDDDTKKDLVTLLPELDCHTSFFVPLPFGEPVESGCSQQGSCSSSARSDFEHLCINDLYSGSLTVTGPDRFEWNWSIVGPAKDGTISCSFRREVQPATAAQL